MKYLTHALSLVVVAALGVAMVGTTTTSKIEVQGHLVDSKCYGDAAAMGKPAMNYNNKHMVPDKDGGMKEVPNCATACANMGIPAAIVEGSEPGNKTYLIVTPSQQLADHMDKEARVVGTQTFEGGITPETIEVKEDGEWKEVDIQLMM